MTLKEKVYEIICDMMPEENRWDREKEEWVIIEDYTRLPSLGIDLCCNVIDLARKIEEVYPYMFFDPNEINTWETARDVFESVEIQEDAHEVMAV